MSPYSRGIQSHKVKPLLALPNNQSATAPGQPARTPLNGSAITRYRVPAATEGDSLSGHFDDYFAEISSL